MVKDLGKCCVTVYPNDRWGSFHGHLCRKKAIIIRDQKSYCKIHDPVFIEQKNKAKYEKWDRENEKSNEKFRRQQAMIKACYNISTEDLERINIKELIERLK